MMCHVTLGFVHISKEISCPLKVGSALPPSFCMHYGNSGFGAIASKWLWEEISETLWIIYAGIFRVKSKVYCCACLSLYWTREKMSDKSELVTLIVILFENPRKISHNFPNSQFFKFPIFQIPKFPNSQFSKFPIFQIPNFPNSQFSKFPIFPIPNFPNSHFSKFTMFQIHKFLNSQFAKFTICQIHSLPNSQFSKFTIIQIHNFTRFTFYSPNSHLATHIFGNSSKWDKMSSSQKVIQNNLASTTA